MKDETHHRSIFLFMCEGVSNGGRGRTYPLEGRVQNQLQLPTAYQVPSKLEGVCPSFFKDCLMQLTFLHTCNKEYMHVAII